MKQFLSKFGLIICLLCAPVVVFGVANSGIDLTQSTIAIAFTRDPQAEVSTITCFGETQSVTNDAQVNIFLTPKTLKSVLSQFKDNISNNDISRKHIETINININNDGSDLQKCFQNAGRYDVTIKLVDAVGNEDPNPKTFTFVIKPGDVNIDNITSSSDCANTVANGTDVCRVIISLKDSFGNTVYNANTAQVLFPTAQDGMTESDANFGLKLKDGLLLNNVPINWDTNQNINGVHGKLSLDFTSWSPTISNERNVSFDTPKELGIRMVSVPQINSDGSVGSGRVLINKLIENPRPQIQFNRSILLDFELLLGKLVGGDQTANDQLLGSFSTLNDDFANNLSNDQRIKISLVPRFLKPVSPVGNISGGFFNLSQKVQYYRRVGINTTDLVSVMANIDRDENLPSQVLVKGSSLPIGSESVSHSYLDAASKHIGLDFNASGVFSQLGNTQNPSNYFNNVSNKVNYIFNFDMAETKSGNRDLLPEFHLQSIVEYDINLGGAIKKLRYFAGSSLGLINLAKGIYIEGTVIKRDEETKFLSNDLSALSGFSQTDIRENLTRNAFALSRESNNVFASNNIVLNDSTHFSTSDIAVVKGRNVQVSGRLPSGKKTLVIIDGNLLISGNTWYNDESSDSFGVMLVNTKSISTPANGNIFVHSSVHSVRGSFFADGGIMNTDSNMLAGLSTNSATHASKKQLRLVGALISMNTAGGTAKNKKDPYLYHPWGKDLSDVIPKRYDLLHIRDLNIDETKCLPLGSYNLQDSTLLGNCQPPDATAPATHEKGYSFILRFDRKVLEQAPPGFTKSQSISR